MSRATRADPETFVAMVQFRVLAEAWLEGHRSHWLRRAEQLEAARPRAGDFHGQATPADLRAAYDRLTAAAMACRQRATGLDGYAIGTLAEASDAEAQEVA